VSSFKQAAQNKSAVLDTKVTVLGAPGASPIDLQTTSTVIRSSVRRVQRTAPAGSTPILRSGAALGSGCST